MEEYISRLHQYISKREFDDEEKSSREIFLENAVQFISDVAETTELILTSYDNDYMNMRADGYDLLSENEIIIYISDYSDSESELSQKEAEDYTQKVCSYLLEAQKGLSEKLNGSDEIRQLSDYIYGKKDSIKKVSVYIVSSRVFNGNSPAGYKVGNTAVETQIFDVSFLKEHGFLQEHEEEEIIVSFDEPAAYIRCEEDSDEMDVYMMFMRGKDIAEAYQKYGYLLLTGNVRTYLKSTNKNNAGIIETITSVPDRFVSYNNGISAVASEIETDDGRIESITGFQIVNGGQTTASIAEAYKENQGELKKDIFVPVKVTVLKKQKNKEELVAKIAEYANTQSKVSQSDLNSNEVFHIELEKLSRKICVPVKVKGKELRKWYYERLRGQYDLEASRTEDQKGFKEEYPKDNKFDKLDLAKGIIAWEQEPFTCALGKEKCFGVFNLRLKGNADQFKADEQYYRNAVSLVILYKEIAKIVKEKRYGGFGSNVVEYTFSVLSLLSEKKLNLEKIWEDQGINEKLKKVIRAVADDVSDVINDTPKEQRNVQMYCRMESCWDKVKKHNFGIVLPDEYISEDEEVTMLENTSRTVVNGVQMDLNDLSPEYWFEMSAWGKETNALGPSERKMAFTAGRIANNGYQWKSDKQRDFAKAVYQKAVQNGYLWSGKKK